MGELRDKIREKLETPVKSTVPEVSVSDDVRTRAPSKWRALVDDILGKDFGCEVEESVGGDYRIKITVPDEYDCRIGDERSMSKRDIRTGFVHRATDESDVEKWCNLIKSNIQKQYPKF
jgi:hypothetical protein